MVLTRKIQLIPVGNKEEINRVYKYLQDGIYSQNKAMNQYISALYVSAIQDISKEDRSELNKLYGRISTSKKGSAYDKNIIFLKGLPIGALTRKVRQDFSKSCKDGLLYGKVSLPMYKKDNPFKMIFGSPHKSYTLREEIKQIFEENYKVCSSTIQIDGKKIILNLSMEVPKNDVELDENIVVGVDLGIAIPAMCALNNNEYIRKSIGSKDDFLRVRTQLQSQRRRLQKTLKISNGGHGRNKKLQALNKLKNRERNFVRTYNHYVSKQVIDFAVKNKAKYINVEDLSGFDSSKFILRNWSFYELQQFITYKAAKYGIEVRKVNPYHTSQICCKCGHWEEGQRIDQAHFVCKKCGNETNADFNAARNIAMSVDFIDKKKEVEITCNNMQLTA